ncbi:MAG: hypothetical protein JXA49_00830 [Actinobacteria bacterium]|nr:hypothetical protein [Actinomycetota bacterium]
MGLITGAILAVIATSLINYSNYVQKRELENLPRIGTLSTMETVRAFVNCRPWLKAQGMQILGAWTHNVAVGFAPLSVVQPINASGICLLVVLAITRLKERASPVDWIGIGSIVSGVILLSISLFNTPTQQHEYRPIVLWFFIVLMIGAAISSLIAAFVRKDERASSFLGIAVGLMVGLTAILTKLAWSDIADRWGEYKIAGFIYSSYFWMAIVLTLISAILFQVALQRGLAIVVVPLVTGFSNLIPIVVGFLAFREPFPKSPLMAAFRLVSILLIIGGAILLSLRKGEDPQKKVFRK